MRYNILYSLWQGAAVINSEKRKIYIILGRSLKSAACRLIDIMTSRLQDFMTLRLYDFKTA